MQRSLSHVRSTELGSTEIGSTDLSNVHRRVQACDFLGADVTKWAKRFWAIALARDGFATEGFDHLDACPPLLRDSMAALHPRAPNGEATVDATDADRIQRFRPLAATMWHIEVLELVNIPHSVGDSVAHCLLSVATHSAQLTRLKLQGTIRAWWLAPLANMRALTHLHVDLDGLIGEILDLRALDLRSVRTLELPRSNHQPEQQHQFIETIASVTALRALDLSDSAVFCTAKVHHFLATALLGCADALTRLILRECGMWGRAAEDALEVIASLHELRVLDLSRNSLEECCPDSVEKVGGLSKLESLHVAEAGIDREYFAHMAAKLAKSVRCVDMGHFVEWGDFEDAGHVLHVMADRAGASMQSLRLRGFEVKAADLKPFTELTSLDLRECRLDRTTPASMASLLKSMPSLMHLAVAGYTVEELEAHVAVARRRCSVDIDFMEDAVHPRVAFAGSVRWLRSEAPNTSVAVEALRAMTSLTHLSIVVPGFEVGPGMQALTAERVDFSPIAALTALVHVEIRAEYRTRATVHLPHRVPSLRTLNLMWVDPGLVGGAADTPPAFPRLEHLTWACSLMPDTGKTSAARLLGACPNLNSSALHLILRRSHTTGVPTGEGVPTGVFAPEGGLHLTKLFIADDTWLGRDGVGALTRLRSLRVDVVRQSGACTHIGKLGACLTSFATSGMIGAANDVAAFCSMLGALGGLRELVVSGPGPWHDHARACVALASLRSLCRLTWCGNSCVEVGVAEAVRMGSAIVRADTMEEADLREWDFDVDGMYALIACLGATGKEFISLKVSRGRWCGLGGGWADDSSTRVHYRPVSVHTLIATAHFEVDVMPV